MNIQNKINTKSRLAINKLKLPSLSERNYRLQLISGAMKRGSVMNLQLFKLMLENTFDFIELRSKYI